MSSPKTNRWVRLLFRGIACFALAAVLTWDKTASARTMPREEIVRIVHDAAVGHGRVPPELALAVARVESNFDDEVVSSAGAIGVMQIMPRTGADEFGVAREDLFDARTNIRIGVAFLHRLYEMYGQRWDLALSHYNGGTLSGGPGANAIPHGYTTKYVSKVLGEQMRFEKSVLVASLRGRSNDGGDTASAPLSRAKMPQLLRFAFANDPAHLSESGRQKSYSDYLELGDRWRRISKGETVPSPEEPARQETVLADAGASVGEETGVDYAPGRVTASPAALDLLAKARQLRQKFRGSLSGGSLGG